MPKLAYTDADGAPAEHLVRDEPVTIGKSANCDIRISGEGIARLHAVVEPSGTKLRVRDQESSGGTWVGGEKVTADLSRQFWGKLPLRRPTWSGDEQEEGVSS